MLPTTIYEPLPYSYMVAGLVGMMVLPSALGVASGALLFLAGALVWIVRSEHRREDDVFADRKNGPVPFWGYELLPFACLLLALTIFVLPLSQLFYPSAAILLIVGMQLWITRNMQRRHRPALTN
ncbi:hypothetical protein SAMN06297280_2686 [Arsukibacterium tuosuense]|uniref:Uncharacterized protein n=1 Tax=Arsukibacterium tuosuense TaxID=1323745 RepID=A0A285J2R7_9GAMM|nr:hypothetical protein [Arsukibacterium tuosuense]SNY54589.1 hypothetical protein SAMN06297280_2686 [Arsukibacterium tuosuense]